MTRKPVVVLGGLLLCALLGLLLAQTWVTGTPQGGLGGGSELALSGSETTQVARACVFTAAAGLLAAAFLGPVARRVAGTVVVLSGLAVLASAAGVLADPTAPVARAAAEDWGLADASGVTAQASATVLPWVAAAVGLGLALDGVLVLLARWEGLGARYERTPRRSTEDEPLWDSLSRGEDPT